MNNDFKGLKQTGETAWHGEEISPFLQVGVGVKYPIFSVDTLINNANAAQKSWSKTSASIRAGILIETLERISARFLT